jgi:hypothetical protein
MTSTVLNAALDQRSKTFDQRRFTTPPKLNDFYKPSAEAVRYGKMSVITAGLGSGYLVAKYVL